MFEFDARQVYTVSTFLLWTVPSMSEDDTTDVGVAVFSFRRRFINVTLFVSDTAMPFTSQ
jgi:hypothetical protein